MTSNLVKHQQSLYIPAQAISYPETSWIQVCRTSEEKYSFLHFRVLTLHTLIWKYIRSIIFVLSAFLFCKQSHQYTGTATPHFIVLIFFIFKGSIRAHHLIEFKKLLIILIEEKESELKLINSKCKY